MVYTCNPRQENQRKIQGHPQLHTKLEASLVYMGPF